MYSAIRFADFVQSLSFNQAVGDKLNVNAHITVEVVADHGKYSCVLFLLCML